MYCGNNKTALASQRQIADALLDLLAEQPYAEISVSAVCKRARVSRQTFYSLFQSKENVMTFALRNDCCYSSPEEGARKADFRQLCVNFSRYIIGHADALRLLERHGLMALLRSVLREDLAHCPAFSRHLYPALAPYALDYVAAGIASIAETYARAGGGEDEDALADIICALLRGKYIEYTEGQAEREAQPACWS